MVRRSEAGHGSTAVSCVAPLASLMQGLSRSGVGRRELAFGLLSLVACGVVEPREVELEPAVVPPLAPGDTVAAGRVVFQCGWWVGFDTLPDRLWVDAYHGNHDADSRSITHAPVEWVQEIEAAGGIVLERFNFPITRVDLPTAAVPTLYESGAVDHFRAVPFRDRTDAEILALPHYIEDTDSLASLFESYGGVVSVVLPNFRIVSGDLPNESADLLRAEAIVRLLQTETMGCPLR